MYWINEGPTKMLNSLRAQEHDEKAVEKPREKGDQHQAPYERRAPHVLHAVPEVTVNGGAFRGVDIVGYGRHLQQKGEGQDKEGRIDVQRPCAARRAQEEAGHDRSHDYADVEGRVVQ